MIEAANQWLKKSEQDQFFLDGRKQNISFAVGSIESACHSGDDDGFDVVYSNAALHWVPPRQQLPVFGAALARLVRKGGGVLAAQMPDTINQPSHVLMLQTVSEDAVNRQVVCNWDWCAGCGCGCAG